jgi:hypothetical protein
MREIRTLRATWRGLETWCGSEPRATPARQPSTLPMDGVKLAHFVRNRWPPVKIIATSAHARIEGYDLPNGGRFLPKPYSAREVATHLKDLTNFEPGGPT